MHGTLERTELRSARNFKNVFEVLMCYYIYTLYPMLYPNPCPNPYRKPYPNPSLTHTQTHTLAHTLTHILTHTLTNTLTHTLTHTLKHTLTHTLTYTLTIPFEILSISKFCVLQSPVCFEVLCSHLNNDWSPQHKFLYNSATKKQYEPIKI